MIGIFKCLVTNKANIVGYVSSVYGAIETSTEANITKLSMLEQNYILKYSIIVADRLHFQF